MAQISYLVPISDDVYFLNLHPQNWSGFGFVTTKSTKLHMWEGEGMVNKYYNTLITLTRIHSVPIPWNILKNQCPCLRNSCVPHVPGWTALIVTSVG